MPPLRRAAMRVLPYSLLLVVVASSGCLARRRVITRQGARPTQSLLTADKQTLMRQVADRYEEIRSFSATVDMVPALGTANKGKITEYKDFRGYILFRKPADIRLIGLYPVVRNKAFDMVSNGTQFRLFLPAKNQFVVGRNQIGKPSPNPMENWRPQHFLEALVVEPVADESRTLLVNFTDEDNAAYILETLRAAPDGQLWLRRQLWFERVGLRMVRQIIFNETGDILTDARYTEWQVYDQVPFPKRIDINRPKDEYGVVMTVVKMDINQTLSDDKFVLERPEGTELKVLGVPPETAIPATPGEGPGKR